MLHIIGKRGKGVTILDTSSWKEETVNVKTLEHLRESGIKVLENTPITTPEALKLKTLGLAEIVLNGGGYLKGIRGNGKAQFNLSDVCRGLSVFRNTDYIEVVGEWYLYIDDRFKLNGKLPALSREFDRNAKLILDLSKCTPSGALHILDGLGAMRGILLVNVPVDDDVYYTYLLKYLETELVEYVSPYFQEAFKPLTGIFLSDYLDKVLVTCDSVKAHDSRSIKFYKQGHTEMALWDVWRGHKNPFAMLLVINTMTLLKNNPNFPPSVSERVMKAVDGIFNF